jgi:hypothetical protein
MRASERLIFGHVDGQEEYIWSRNEGWDIRINVMSFRVAVSLDRQQVLGPGEAVRRHIHRPRGAFDVVDRSATE